MDESVSTQPREEVPGHDDSLLGLNLQGYVVCRALSSGGMGVVYEAQHTLIGQRAAVKVLRPELCNDADLTARFLREAQALSAIKHPNIVEILNFGVLPSGGQFIMMEFLDGETLTELITRSGFLEPQRALQICEEILAGLSAAHEVGVVHRDLKPENVILTRQSSGELIAKLVDFGLSQRADKRSTDQALAPPREGRSSMNGGTPEYMSPEQASGKLVNGQADLYCLGVMLFEMLTGQRPFDSDSASQLVAMHLSAPPPRLSSFVPNVPAAVQELVDRLLAKEPRGRPSSARAARDMVRVLRGLEPEHPVALLPERELPIFGPLEPADPVMHVEVKQPGSRARWLWRTIGAAALLSVIGIGSFAIRSSAATSPPPVHPDVVPPLAPLVLDPPKDPAPAPPDPVPAPPPTVAPPPAPEPAPPPPPPRVIPRPRPTVAALSVRRKSAPAPSQSRAPASTPAPRALCSADDAWRHDTRLEVEDLEQRALAGLKDPGDARAVEWIKRQARELTAELRRAQGTECESVERELRAWRKGLP